MGDFLSKIWDFFSNERISLTPKITIPLLLIMIAFLFVDYYGFFYYYANSEKVEYLSKIEEAKEKCASDTILVSYLDGMMNDAMNRKNVFQWFGLLFENKNVETISYKNSNATEDIFPLCERNRLWHTITSSLLGIVVMGIALAGLVYVFIFGSNNKSVVFARIIMLILVSVLIIWLSQWIFGLIPVIAGRAYINYILNSIINIIIITLVYRKLDNSEGTVIK